MSVPRSIRRLIRKVLCALQARRRWVYWGLGALVVAGFVAAVTTRSVLALAVAVLFLTGTVAASLVEMRRVPRRLARAEHEVKRLGAEAGRAEHEVKRLRAEAAEMRRVQDALAVLLYERGTATEPPGSALPEPFLFEVARGLLTRGDPLGAYAWLVSGQALKSFGLAPLRRLRDELRRGGYLVKALEVARVVRSFGENGQDVHVRRQLQGEIAVLSGKSVPSVRVEGGFEARRGRVLHVVGSALPHKQSGYTVRTHYIVLAQRALGLDPHVVTQMGVDNDGDEYVRQELDGVTYHRIPGPARGTVPLDEWLQANAQRVANVVRVVRPAMLHAASDFLNALTALVVGREFGIPVVYESRGFWEETWLSRQAQAFGWDLARLEARHGLPDAYRWRREIEDRCRRDAQHVVTLAEGMADRIEAGGVPRDRITVVPNGVDVDAFPVLTRNGGLAARLGIGEDTTVVGYISSLVEYEGIDTLLAAYKQVEAAASAPVALLIVGDGLERERLQRQASELGLRQAIFTGRVPHDDVLDYYSLIDLFVVPRKPVEVCHLVTPLKPFEAFATGRTVVLSNVRALARIAEQSQAAELFEAGSAQSLAEVLDKLLADPQRCRNLAEAGAQWVRAERTWTANAGIYVRLYESMGVHTTEANLLAETVGIDELRRSLPQEKLFEPESGSPPESADGDLAFRSRPFVCGAIGRWDPTVAERLRGAAPKPLRPIFASESALLCATSGLDEWTDGARRGFYWSPLASGPAPASWQSAAERRLAAGLVVDADEAVLHTCGLGLQELYVREMGDALYFAGRIDPLTELDDAPLHADMAAWASVLGLGCPVGEATGFVEIRRILGATAWQARAGRLNRLSFEPAWLAIEPVDSAGPDEVVDLVADQIPSDIERLALPLSGGWDSRLLAALAARRSRTTSHAWTCSTDDGKEFDLTMAGPVADALGLEHHLVVAGPDAWLDNREAARARMQYQTWYHTWLMPLARVLWRQRDAVLDGLAGDLLIGGHDLPSAEMRTPASSLDLRLAFMAQLSGGRLRDNDMLAPATSEWAEEGVRAGFLQCTDRFDGHPSALSLCHLVIRTARAIAPAPTWLLGPETRVHLPFVHPDVIAAALRVAEERKVDGAFYRRVLEAGCGPRVAILPSTHDPRRRSAPFFRRQNSPAALASMAKSIGADEEVRALLSPQLLAALADPEALTPIVRDPIRRVTLQWADMLAHWRRRYANRVVW